MEYNFFNRPKNIAEQLIYLNSKYEGLTGSGIYANKLIWLQKVKPSPSSKIYTLKIEYDMSVPKVYLNNQGILKSTEDTIPHNYYTDYKSDKNQIVQLCLFYPKKNEWKKYMYIADTIIPWAIEWIYYYEIWRITGEWYGGGVHNA